MPEPAIAGGASDFAEKPTHTFFWENDALVDSDRYYTNGVRWTRQGRLLKETDGSHLPERVPFWARGIHRRLVKAAGGAELTMFRGIGYTNVFYTPEDLKAGGLLVDDRPYAGWSYVSSIFAAILGQSQHRAEVSVGVIGPWAFGEELQKFAHEHLSRRSPEPQGWDNQLENEPAIQGFYEYRWRPEKLQWWNADHDRLYFDAGPVVTATAGTVMVRGGVGFSARLGYNVPPGFPSRIEPVGPDATIAGKYSIYLFFHADAQGVAWNTFLDGNIFSDSHSVEKESFIATAGTGLSFRCGRYTFTYQTLSRSEEFELQAGRQSWGSFSFSVAAK